MTTPAEKIERQLAQVPALFGRGPVSYGYGQWVDETHHLLATLFGDGSAEERAFMDIVGEGAEARGWGLPLAPANQWGMQKRLQRASEYLQSLLGTMQPASRRSGA